MRIGFVRPSMSGLASADALQPLVFSLVRALTPPDVDLVFRDGMLGDAADDLAVDAVAFSVETFAARSAYELADAYRAHGVPVIMGGHHPTMLPDEASEHADVVVLGEAEDTWPQIVADLRAGRLASRYVSTNSADLTIVGDDRVIDRRRYPPIGLVQFSRGCRYTCEFCSVHAFYGHRVRTKPIEAIVAEVARRPEKLLFFVDDNLFADRERARTLFAALVGLGKRWVCQISMDAAGDPDLLALMRRAGCVMVLVGFESLEVANLKQMRKGANLKAGDYARVLATIRAAGLMVYGTFVVGYDADTAATASELREFAEAHGFAIANFNPLMPMPGTALYDRLAADGRLRHDRWWLDDEFRYGDAMFTPAGMAPAELMASCRHARYAFTSWPSIVRRALAPANRRPVNLGIHLVSNVVSRRAIRAKQGAELGGRVPV